MKLLYSATTFDSPFDLMQNDALSAIALHSFTWGYHQIAKHKMGQGPYPKLNYMFFVLPLVYNYSALTTFLRSTEVYTALNKEPSVRLGLQARSQKMTQQTFDGLNIAFSKKILGYNEDDSTIILMHGFSSKKLPLTLDAERSYDSVKQIQDCASRVGQIFAKVNEKNIQNDLNITF
jgi:hypothetical protein